MYQFSIESLLLSLVAAAPVLLVVVAGVLAVTGRYVRGVAVFVGAIFLGWILLPSTVHLDQSKWWQISLWKHVVLYGFMVVGMIASVLFKAIEAREAVLKLRKRGGRFPKLDLDVWSFVKPLLVSWITFGVVNSQIGNADLNLGSIFLSMQTGFCWETILGKRRK